MQLLLWSKYSYAWICFAFALHTTYFKKYLKNDILNAKESSYLQKSNTFTNIMLLNGTGGGYKNQKIQFTRIAGRFAPFLLRTHCLYHCILFVHKCLFVYIGNVGMALPFKLISRCRNGTNGQGISLVCNETKFRVRIPMDKYNHSFVQS